ncbi:MAG TPA: hypothetical protein V6C69_19490 [Trichormus sp.]|jgi:hypothetical protein
MSASLASIVVAFSGFYLVASAEGTKGVEGWMMTATKISAKMRIFSLSDRVCVDTGVMRFLFKLPDVEQVRVVSDESKLYYTTTIGAYRQTYYHDRPAGKKRMQPNHLRSVSGNESISQVKFIRSEPKCGFKCNYYEGAWPGGIARMWYTKAIHMDKKLADAVCQFVGVPVGYGLPITVVVESRDKTQSFPLFSILTATKTMLTNEPFVVPASYRVTKDMSNLFLPKEDLDSLFGVAEDKLKAK